MKTLVIYAHGKGGNADYVRENPIKWSIPTKILYGSNDNLTSLETMRESVRKIGASLTVMDGGEHWFHTAEQMAFLDRWVREYFFGGLISEINFTDLHP